MRLPVLALLVLACSCVVAHGQSLTRTKQVSTTPSTDQVRAQRAINALKRLDDDVIVYRSLGDFEETNKLARVSFETFNADLRAVTAEVEAVLIDLPDSRVKQEIRNSLSSYRDGAFWWARVYQPRVINVSALTPEPNRTQADAFLRANTPYTVGIHWRQAHRYLQRAIATLKT